MDVEDAFVLTSKQHLCNCDRRLSNSCSLGAEAKVACVVLYRYEKQRSMRSKNVTLAGPKFNRTIMYLGQDRRD